VTTAVLGLDIGTTNVKGAVVEAGDEIRITARASSRHRTTRPRSGWAEQEPDEWLAGVSHVLLALASELHRLSAVCVVGQGSTVVLSDDFGTPLGSAISWQDLRATREAQRIDSELRPLLDKAHGNAIGDAPEPKLIWLARERPEFLERARWASTPASLVAVWLGAAPHISVGDAGSWLSFDRHDNGWSREIAGRLGLEALLAEVVPAGTVVGEVSQRAAEETGLSVGVPIVAGSTDVASAAIGAGVGRVGEVFYSKGTGGFVCAHVDAVVHPGRLLALPVGRGGIVQLCGATDTLGAAWDWCRSILGGLEHTEAESLARAAQAGSGGLIFLPWLQGAQHPVLNPSARGIAFGLSLETAQGELLRAVLEGAALGLREQLTLARNVAAEEFSLVVSSGGPTRSRLWNQLDAAAAATPVLVVPETNAAIGAALLAGEAVQLWEDALEVGAELRGPEEVYEPDPELAQVAATAAILAQKLARSTLPLFEQLATLRD
jgi:xylulokinase